MLLPIASSQVGPYRRTLTGVYTKRIKVVVLDRSGDVITPITQGFRDGQIVVDQDTDVDRSANLTILDPQHRFGFDADTYSGGILDLTRMVRVWWQIDSDLLAKPVTIPVFTGPIIRLQRDGALITIEAQGKEVYGLGENRRTLTIKKGTRKTEAIKTILRELMGETRMDVPDLPARLPKDLVVSKKDRAWPEAQKLAQAVNRQLYYDGSGTARLRPRPKKAVWTFNGGENGGELTTGVTTSSDLTKVVNHVRVVGPKPKGKKQPIIGTATANRNHPLSPWKLGPPGAPKYLTKEINNEHIRTQKEANDLAEDTLDAGLKLVHEVSFQCSPVPGLDPGDLVAVRTEHESLTTGLRSFTLPLGLGGDMVVGKRSTKGLRARRRRRVLTANPINW